MKALSLRQPWAHAVLHLGKRVENRDWKGCGRRGTVLLHASKTLVLRDFDEEIDSIIDIVNPKPGDERLKMLKPLAYMSVPLRGKRHGEGTWRPAPSLPLGGIVGRARIDGIINDSRDFAAYAAGVDGGQRQRAWWTGGFALVLADVEPMPFIPWKGSLGFFDVPDATVREAETLWPGAGEVRDLPIGGDARIEDWAARGLVEILRGGPTQHVYRLSGWNGAQS